MAAPGKPATQGVPPPAGVARPADPKRFATGTFAIPKRQTIERTGAVAGGVRGTAEPSAGIPGAPKRIDPDSKMLAQQRQQRLDRMIRRATVPQPERTLSTAKALRGMLDVRMRGSEVTLPVLPAVAAKLNAELSLPNADMHRVADIISSDVAVAAKVLQVANSAMFRGASPITTVGGAVVRLGMRTTTSIVMTVCHKSLYRANPAPLHEIMEDLFTHALASAAFARELAILVKYRAPEEAFLIALLHDVASPLILRLVSELLQANSAVVVGEPEFVALVNQLHTEVGATLLKKWELSGAILYAVENHDHLTQDHPHSLINNITFLANILAQRNGFALVESPGADQKEEEGIKALGLTAAQMVVLRDKVIDRTEQEIAIFSGS